jgi:tRNA/rRNA methyltransferase
MGPATPIVNDPSLNGGEPTIAGTTVTVGALVSYAYASGLDAARSIAPSALAPEVIDAALSYCAKRSCDAAAVYCSGCRLRTEQDGITSIDAFLGQYATTRFDGANLMVAGPGTGDAPNPPPTIDALVRLWRGEEIYYLARRVIRRRKQDLEPRPKRMAGHLDAGPTPTMILVRPQLADNIGMVARAMANFGLEDLRLVAPRDGWPNEKALIAASGADFIIDAAPAFATLAGAMADLNYVVATTARQRDLTKPVLTPEQAATEIMSRMADGQRCGVLFGPERTGLDGDEVAVADAIVMAPVNPRFASLNLAQAALLFGYEWMKASHAGTLGRVTTFETPLQTGLHTRKSEPATKEELLGFVGQLESELERLGFFNSGHKRQAVMRNIHSMFARMDATEQEVRTLRGIVATLSKGKGPSRKPST